jgi:hypothetical protein
VVHKASQEALQANEGSPLRISCDCESYEMIFGSGSQDLTNRWSQPPAAVMTTFDFVKQFSMFVALAAASGGAAPSR